MDTSFVPGLRPKNWKTLYRAAVFEANKSTVLERISEAEKAVLARGRELFYADGTQEEKEDLEDALYALRAFRIACQHVEPA